MAEKDQRSILLVNIFVIFLPYKAMFLVLLSGHFYDVGSDGNFFIHTHSMLLYVVTLFK